MKLKIFLTTGLIALISIHSLADEPDKDIKAAEQTIKSFDADFASGKSLRFLNKRYFTKDSPDKCITDQDGVLCMREYSGDIDEETILKTQWVDKNNIIFLMRAGECKIPEIGKIMYSNNVGYYKLFFNKENNIWKIYTFKPIYGYQQQRLPYMTDKQGHFIKDTEEIHNNDRITIHPENLNIGLESTDDPQKYGCEFKILTDNLDKIDLSQ